jgi:hypothetical protein
MLFLAIPTFVPQLFNAAMVMLLTESVPKGFFTFGFNLLVGKVTIGITVLIDYNQCSFEVNEQSTRSRILFS